MELIRNKSSLIIDNDYKPNISGTLIEYFNRSLVFAQTNYKNELEKANRISFSKMTPTTFLEEYAWCVYCSGINAKTASTFQNEFRESVQYLFPYLRDSNLKIDPEPFIEHITKVCKNKSKLNAVLKTLHIVQNGIRLFGWEYYRDIYLHSSETLMALPYMGPINSMKLAKSIGLKDGACGGKHLNRLSARWGFNNSNELCVALQKNFPMKLRCIELILWLAANEFGTNIKMT